MRFGGLISWEGSCFGARKWRKRAEWEGSVREWLVGGIREWAGREGGI